MRQTVQVPPTTVDPRLSAVLRRLRAEREWSQQQLSSRANITISAYNAIEQGRSGPAWITVVRIARALEVSLGELGKLVEAENEEA